LACLDRLLADALVGSDGHTGSREIARHVSMSEAMFATIYASFNGAYVYPRFTACHEAFTVGAWLGYLARGRAALMPTFVADHVVERFAGSQGNWDAETGACDLLLRHCAESTVGLGRLQKIARRVVNSGRPNLVIPQCRPRGDLLMSPDIVNSIVSAQFRKLLNSCNIKNCAISS
jgi:hypothetical protein